MIKNNLYDITIKLPDKFENILKKIDKNGLGVVFVVNDDFKLLGSISDGDIRRHFLKKKKHSPLITEKFIGINKRPISLPSNSDVGKIQEILN